MSPTAREPAVFFQPSPDSPVADVLGALEGLAARSRGEVKDGAELHPGIFARTEGGRFQRLPVDHGSEYYERDAHLLLPGGFLHPALAPVVASLLGWTPDEALAVARSQAHVEGTRAVPSPHGLPAGEGPTGPQALVPLLRGSDAGPWREQLAALGLGPDALIVDRLPVPPLSRRPLVRHGPHTVPGPINVLYRKLQHQAALHPELVRRGEPAIVLEQSIARCQRLGEALLAALTRPPTPTPGPQEPRLLQVWRPAGAPLRLEEPALMPPSADQPVGLAFDEDEGLLLQYPHALVHLTREGRVAGAWAVPFGLQLLSVSDGHVLFFGADRFHVLALRGGAWARDYVPGPLYGAVFSDGWLRNTETRAAVRLAGDPVEAELSGDLDDFVRPCAVSPCNRHVWMTDTQGGGTVFHVATAEREWDIERGEAAAPVLTASGALLTPEVHDEDALESALGGFEWEACQPEPPAGLPGAALVCLPDGRFRLLHPEDGVIRDEGTPLLRLAMPVAAAAFSRDGQKLAIASRAEVRVIALEPQPHLRSRHALEELGPALPQEDVEALPEG